MSRTRNFALTFFMFNHNSNFYSLAVIAIISNQTDQKITYFDTRDLNTKWTAKCGLSFIQPVDKNVTFKYRYDHAI